MLKMMKKALAFVLMATLVLTSMSFSVMAEAITNAYDGKTISSPATNVGITFSTEAEGKGGKSTSDTYYKMISDTGTTSSYYQIDANNNSVQGVFTYEISFMLPNGSAGITLMPGFRIYRYALDWSSTSMSITPSGFNPGGYHNKLVPDTEFEYDKWYNLALVFPYAVSNAEATEGYDYYKTMYIYINGSLKGEITYTASERDDFYEIVFYRRMQISPKDTNPVYVDNIRQYQGTYTPANDAPATLTPVQDGKVATIANGRIGTTERLTSSELIANISKADDTNIRVYSADGALLDGEEIVADNSVLVAAASNGTGMERTYSYYTVAKDATILPGASENRFYNGESKLIMATAYKTSKIEATQCDGIFGKESNDKIISFMVPANNAPSTNASGGFVLPFVDTTSGVIQSENLTNQVFEMSFMLPDNSDGFRIHYQMWKPSNDKDNPNRAIKITNEGFVVDFSDNSHALKYNFDNNKWYNIAIVFPNNGSADSIIYVNGVNEGTLVLEPTAGLRLLSITNNTTKSVDTTFVYADNLRLYDTIYSNAAYDAEDVITPSGFDVDAKKDEFYITADTTVSAVTSSISDINEDTEIIVLNANGEKLTDNDTVTAGCTVVVAAKNGTDHVRTLSYYTVENIAGKFVIKTPVYSGEERNVSASFDTINNTGAAVSVSAIMALYDYDGSLKKVTPVVCTTEANGKGSFADGITMTADDDDDYIKFMIWASTKDDITPKMADVVLFDK